jgi:UDP-GlcNAc:undecaprenyl-phosphate GlcNAc-1-phosphate transferase
VVSSEAAILALGVGAAAAVAGVPVASWVAVRTGFLDHPAGYKKHERPTPYLGGSAVVLAFVVAALAFGDGGTGFLPVVLAAVGLWAVGTIDDRVNLSPWLRVGATVAAGVALWATDLGWDVFAFAGLDLALTVLWVLGLVNAFNLMDNLDGASGSVAAAASAGIGAFALWRDDPALAAMAFGLVGACLGFLRFNLARPARIFLGDGGSMPIGFIVAALAIAAPSVADLGAGAVLTAALLVGLVILDTTLVVISRRRRGVTLLTGGRDHLTHRLLGIVGSARRVAGTLAVAQLALCALALSAAGLGRVAVLWIAAAVAIAGIATIAALEARLDQLEAETSARARSLATARVE